MSELYSVTRSALWAQNWHPRSFVLTKQHKLSRVTIRSYTEGQETRKKFGFSIRAPNTALARSIQFKINKTPAERLQERQFRTWETKIIQATDGKRHKDAIRLWLLEEHGRTNKTYPLDKQPSSTSKQEALKERRRQLIERASSQTVHAVYESYLAELNIEDAAKILLDTIDVKENMWSSNRIQKELKKSLLTLAASPHRLSEYPSVKRNLTELRSRIQKIRNQADKIKDEIPVVFERVIEILKNRGDIESAHMFIDEMIFHDMPMERELTKAVYEERKLSAPDGTSTHGKLTPENQNQDKQPNSHDSRTSQQLHNDQSLKSKMHPPSTSKEEHDTLKIFQGQLDTISVPFEEPKKSPKTKTKLNSNSNQPL